MAVLMLFYSCSENNKPVKEIIKADTKWLDSIKNKSDTSWIKPYRNKDFAIAEYYVDRKDSIVTQLMKDSAGTIRQINIAKYDMVRLFFAEYYANGQSMGKLPLDSAGKYHGVAKFYYKNGVVKSSGLFRHGLYYGEWRNYDEKGKNISTDQYDSNGQLIKTIPAN